MLEGFQDTLLDLMRHQNFFEYFFYGCVAVLVFGIYMGATERIVVYRNFKDVGLIFSMVLFPLTLFFVLVKFGAQDELVDTIITNAGLAYAAFALIIILFNTWKDNPNIFKFLLALYTKIPIAILFILAFIEIFNSKKKNRGILFAVISLLGGIIFMLIKDKTATMPRMFRRYI